MNGIWMLKKKASNTLELKMSKEKWLRLQNLMANISMVTDNMAS